MKNWQQVATAKHIKRTLGIKAAAGYLRNRKWSIESALFILTGRVG